MNSIFKTQRPSSKVLEFIHLVHLDSNRLIQWAEGNHKVVSTCLVWLERCRITLTNRPLTCSLTNSTNFKAS